MTYQKILYRGLIKKIFVENTLRRSIEDVSANVECMKALRQILAKVTPDVIKWR